MIDIPLEDSEVASNIGKIPYDARQHNAKVLINLKVAMYNAYIIGDFKTAYKYAKLIYLSCKPYQKDNKTVTDSIVSIKNWGNQIDHSTYERLIETLMEDLMTTYRDQFMQLSQQDEGEFNPADALGDG